MVTWEEVRIRLIMAKWQRERDVKLLEEERAKFRPVIPLPDEESDGEGG